MDRTVYADNAATTAVSPQVLEAMLPYYKEVYGNPSSLYSVGQKAKAALEEARETVAACLGAEAGEIYFTSCGTESDNWAIKGAAHAMRKKGKDHIITSAFEHHAVLHTCQALEKEGFTVTYLPVHENGIVRPEELEAAITDRTGLVTIMYANNEIGTIQPIPEIGAICKKHGVWFHTDAVQAVGNVHIHVKEQNIDMLSLSGHKFHAPKGVGALYIRRGIAIPNLLDGGAQERGKRGGTENVAQIVGLAAGLKEACATIDQRVARLSPPAGQADGRPAEDRPLPCQRRPGAPAAGQREHVLPGGGRGESPADAGPEGHQRLLRFRLHQRVPGPQPRAAVHRPAPRGGPRLFAALLRGLQHRRGHRLYFGGAAAHHPAAALHVSPVGRHPAGQGKLRRLYVNPGRGSAPRAQSILTEYRKE